MYLSPTYNEHSFLILCMHFSAHLLSLKEVKAVGFWVWVFGWVVFGFLGGCSVVYFAPCLAL